MSVLQRILEPELMDDDAQARAYAEADFHDPHGLFVERLEAELDTTKIDGVVLDLGCGPGDISIRIATTHPRCRVHGIDGSAAMLHYGRQAVQASGVAGRVRLVQGYLPADRPPLDRYEVIVSNSLLHHLHQPLALWQVIKQHAWPDTTVMVMDLMRPGNLDDVEALLETYMENAPEILRRDFRNSLRAAFTPAEVRQQLAASGLERLAVETISDRHLVVAGKT